MYVIGKAGEEILVRMNRHEFGAITGDGFYGNVTQGAFESGATPHVEVRDPIENILKVVKIPAQLNELSRNLEAIQEKVDAAKEAAAQINCLADNKQPKKM